MLTLNLNLCRMPPLTPQVSKLCRKLIFYIFQDRKITKTSFLDDSFRKNLESALRFGNPLLVQDVENYDPILNPVLNKELKRTGGRVLITLGDQDIDLSPSFTIFLSTRDPTVEFPPDICSRYSYLYISNIISVQRVQKALIMCYLDLRKQGCGRTFLFTVWPAEI